MRYYSFITQFKWSKWIGKTIGQKTNSACEIINYSLLEKFWQNITKDEQVHMPSDLPLLGIHFKEITVICENLHIYCKHIYNMLFNDISVDKS